MCTSNSNKCSHIAVKPPEVAELVQMLEGIALTSCDYHAEWIMRAVCFIRHEFSENSMSRPSAESIRKLAEFSENAEFAEVDQSAVPAKPLPDSIRKLAEVQ